MALHKVVHFVRGHESGRGRHVYAGVSHHDIDGAGRSVSRLKVSVAYVSIQRARPAPTYLISDEPQFSLGYLIISQSPCPNLIHPGRPGWNRL